MKTKKKYWLFFKSWVLILLNEGSYFKIDFKRMPDYWIFYIGRFMISNNVINLTKDWGNL